MYKLKNGQILEVSTETIKGMAGEPMQVVKITAAGKPVKFTEIKHLMNSNDANDLGEYLDDIYENNRDSAINWSI